jgi:hypothetical protein
MPSIRRLADTAALDRTITQAEAQGLVDKAKADGKITSYEKAQLKSVIQVHGDKFEPGALALVKALVDRVPTPPPGGGAVALDPTPSQRPVFLNSNGAFTTDASGRAPANPVERGEALFRAGELVDNARDNVFNGQPLATREKVFANLQATLAEVKSGSTPTGLDANQTLQTRASAGAVLLHLMEATAEPAQRSSMLKAYEGLVKGEGNVRLRENLIFHLANSPVAQSGEGKAISDTLMKQLAPLAPPYEKWFAGGNNTVKLDWQVGSEFIDGFKRGLTSRGWTESPPSSGTFKKEFDEPGVGKTKFEINVAMGGSNLLGKMAEPGVHILGYDGHANWGKNQMGSINRGPNSADGGDGKVFVSNLCVGKSQIDAMKEKYPNLQYTTTYGSSAVDTDIDGLAKLISKRAGWADITPFFDRTDGRYERNNFVTPTSTLTREKILDRDNDGQADYLDKHFNASTFNVAADTAREFRPVKQDRDHKLLDGTKIGISAQALNTVSEFSTILERINPDSKVVANGWFEPGRGEAEVVKFTKARGKDGGTEYHLSVNANYAHMSEEALRATVAYEFSRFAQSSGEQRLDPVDRKIAGVLSFAQSLDIDDSWRDDDVFKEFLGRYNLPDFNRSQIQSLLDAEHHSYAGNEQMVAAIKAQLSPQALAQLAKPEVGEPVRYL